MLSLRAALATFTEFGAAFEAARTRLDLLRIPPMNRQDGEADSNVAAALFAFEAAPAPRRIAELQAVAEARRRWG